MLGLSVNRCLIVILLIVLTFTPLIVRGERATIDTVTGEVDIKGEVVVDEKLVLKLLQASGALDGLGGIPEQTAIDVAAVIQSASTDPETSLLLHRMKAKGGKEEFLAFQRDMSDDQIVSGLAEVVAEMRSLELLFQRLNPNKAYEEMLGEGLVPAGREKEYKMNPQLLEEDVRKSLYFTFVSLAAAGGYL
jgi:hypothetical protein